MSRVPSIVLLATIFVLAIGLASSISSLQNRVAKLEEGASRMEHSFISCARGVAVMTPSGEATTVCAP